MNDHFGKNKKLKRRKVVAYGNVGFRVQFLLTQLLEYSEQIGLFFSFVVNFNQNKSNPVSGY